MTEKSDRYSDAKLLLIILFIALLAGLVAYGGMVLVPIFKAAG